MGVSEVPPNRDIVAATCSHAVMNDRNDVTEISTCEVESEQQIVTTKEDLTAYKIMCNMYFWMCKMYLLMSIRNKTEKSVN
jgi:hypothetical protein